MFLITDKLPDSLVNGSTVLISTNSQMNFWLFCKWRGQKTKKKFLSSVQEGVG